VKGEIKINRIRARHNTELALLGDVTKMAQEAIPKLRTTAENRAVRRNMEETLSTLGAYCRSSGFDPTRTFQHVANFDTEIWTLVLDMFAKYDPETGEQKDDGLLYKYDQAAGCLKLNKDFFYALLSYFESQGINCDMRGKIKLS
jgi:hypothetical protein